MITIICQGKRKDVEETRTFLKLPLKTWEGKNNSTRTIMRKIIVKSYISSVRKIFLLYTDTITTGSNVRIKYPEGNVNLKIL